MIAEQSYPLIVQIEIVSVGLVVNFASFIVRLVGIHAIVDADKLIEKFCQSRQFVKNRDTLCTCQ